MEQGREIKRQFLDYRQSLFEECPEALKFEKKKKRLLGFLMAICLIYNGGFVLMAGKSLGVSGRILIFALIMRIGVPYIFLLAAMCPKWRIAASLYILAAYQMMETVQGVRGILHAIALSPVNFTKAYVELVFQMPEISTRRPEKINGRENKGMGTLWKQRQTLARKKQPCYTV